MFLLDDATFIYRFILLSFIYHTCLTIHFRKIAVLVRAKSSSPDRKSKFYQKKTNKQKKQAKLNFVLFSQILTSFDFSSKILNNRTKFKKFFTKI